MSLVKGHLAHLHQTTARSIQCLFTSLGSIVKSKNYYTTYNASTGCSSITDVVIHCSGCFTFDEKGCTEVHAQNRLLTTKCLCALLTKCCYMLLCNLVRVRVCESTGLSTTELAIRPCGCILLFIPSYLIHSVHLLFQQELCFAT